MANGKVFPVSNKRQYVDSGERAKDGGYQWDTIDPDTLAPALMAQHKALQDANKRAAELREAFDKSLVASFNVLPPPGFVWSVAHRFGLAARPEKPEDQKKKSGGKPKRNFF